MRIIYSHHMTCWSSLFLLYKSLKSLKHFYEYDNVKYEYDNVKLEV